ncbi:unnamed protein product [Medioppia subpectinata]|uniref:Histone-lysine N-methyltransferase NSD2 n=1 Tax=Medioppia subpectinata TaxID=1979941 RepID=A0A7R9KBM8_9ACAR|nr:unnamed protein product [Medioppia subpectinata]CAG2100211.1 unnamed protein product [Medioppia subpectinata]
MRTKVNSNDTKSSDVSNDAIVKDIVGHDLNDQMLTPETNSDQPVLQTNSTQLPAIDSNGATNKVLDEIHKPDNEESVANGFDDNMAKEDNTSANVTAIVATDVPNGSVVTPKVTRNKRNSVQLTAITPIETPKSDDKQSQLDSEHRLTRSRYGRLQKAKTPNPEMITYDLKRRSSVKSIDASETSETPVKREPKGKRDDKKTTLDESTPNLRKSKRRISESPAKSGRKRRSNKMDETNDEIKSKVNETEAKTPTPASKKKAVVSRSESVPQKKCIELTGDPTSTIVDRHVLLTIPPQEGDYCVGDLIWAKVSGYPWWPCMVSLDPITALYSKVSGMSYKAGRVYHVQYFGSQALRGWTSIGQVMPFEGKDKYSEKVELLKESSPKAQIAKVAQKYAIKATAKKQWDQSVEEAEEAAKMTREERVRSLTFEYILSSKVNLRRKLENSFGEQNDSKRKKLSSSPEDIYDFDDDDASINVSQSTPGLMWRKRVQKGDFAIYVERHYKTVEAENAGANRQEVEEMLQRRWDLLGEDLRALYTDRKFAPTNESESPAIITPKSIASNKTQSESKPKRGRKSKQQTPAKSIVKTGSDGSDCEGNLVISETPVKKSSPKKAVKSERKSNGPSLKTLNSEKKSEPKGTQNKKTPKKAAIPTPKSSKASVEKTAQVVNGTNDKAVQSTDPSLVHFGIDYMDEFTSSEDTSSTSEPEVVDGVKTCVDKFCVVCNESDDSDSLLACQGSCLQMYHKKCSKFEGIDTQFKCIECQTGKHKCFVCKSADNKEEKEPQKCNDTKCGKFYHMSCIEKGFPVKLTELKDSFLCPFHFCLNCHIESQNDKEFRPSRRRLVKCIFCPTAYHLGDYCIAAGTVQVSQNYVICPDHHEKKKKDKHVNVNYCFSCLTGGQLICCESCPAAFHTSCLDYSLDPDSNFYCTDCTSRKPLHYGDIVWVKLGFYRWWPGKVSHPKQVPDNVMKLPHGVGEFPVYFFGSHDYYWVHRGRVFLFMEGDNKAAVANCSGKKNNKSLLKTFKLATEEAAEHFKLWQESKGAIRRAMAANKPPPYTHIRSNKAVGLKVQVTNSDESHISLCECKVKNDVSCNDENCINRALMVECDPKLCTAGDKCRNQRFKKREYAATKPFKTESAGWGLKADEDIKKGQFVIEYVGELIDEDECERRLKSMGDNNQSNFYFLTIDKEKIIDAGPKGNLARFMNHSCQPNCETQKWMVNGATRVGLFAVCDIPTGTELTFNYNLDCRGNGKTKCICGSANCSGFIGVRPKADDNNRKGATNGQTVKKKKKRNEKGFKRMHDDECFTCGEGGDLVMCDRKGCPKSYHLECLKLTQTPKGKWECPRHFCDTCGKAATALCELCPNSLCKEHAIPSKLTQLPDGRLVCSDHPNQDMDELLDNTDDMETARDEKADNEEVAENESSLVLDMSSNANPDTVANSESECLE